MRWTAGVGIDIDIENSTGQKNPFRFGQTRLRSEDNIRAHSSKAGVFLIAGTSLIQIKLMRRRLAFLLPTPHPMLVLESFLLYRVVFTSDRNFLPCEQVVVDAVPDLRRQIQEGFLFSRLRLRSA